jgi:Putative metal-binding motif
VPPIECQVDADCEGAGDLCNPVVCRDNTCRTLAPVDCDDTDPCTTDACDSATGKCSHDHATLDLDRDGHFAPLPGKRPGEPGSCGDDCDDTNPHALPGGTEICDGVDNDCNGTVDDGASFVAAAGQVRISSGNAKRALPAGLGYAGQGLYMASYTGQEDDRLAVYLRQVLPSGSPQGDALRFTQVGPDSFAGPLAWTGDRFGTAWEDRRDAQGDVINFEIYFNELGPDGSKLGPDLRITNAEGFSVSPVIAWTGSEFVVVWEDDGLSFDGLHHVYGQRIDLSGHPVGDTLMLSDPNGLGEESPSIAVGTSSIGIAWMVGDADTHRIMFTPFDRALARLSDTTELTARLGGVYPTVQWNHDSYVVAWYDRDTTSQVYGTVVGEDGNPVVPTRPLTKSPRHARDPALLPYGDRALLVWSDDRDDNQGYELYAKMLDKKLDPASSDQRLTMAAGESVSAIASFGPAGSVGILFRDDREKSPQTYFTALACVGGPLPK